MSKKLIFKDSIDGTKYLVSRIGPYNTNANCGKCFRWQRTENTYSINVNCEAVNKQLLCKLEKLIANGGSQYFYFKLLKYKIDKK